MYVPCIEVVTTTFPPTGKRFLGFGSKSYETVGAAYFEVPPPIGSACSTEHLGKVTWSILHLQVELPLRPGIAKEGGELRVAIREPVDLLETEVTTFHRSGNSLIAHLTPNPRYSPREYRGHICLGFALAVEEAPLQPKLQAAS